MVNLLAVWRAHGLAQILRECWEAGVVLAGTSAGSPCWHLGGPTDSFSDSLAPFTDGLGFLPCSNGVHDDLDDQPRRRIYRQLAGQGSLPPGYATEDGVGLHYVGTRLHEAVSVLFRQAGLVGAAWPGRQLRRAARCPPPALTREDAVPARTHRRRAGHAPLVVAELGVLKTGREADVFLLRRGVPGAGRSCLLAATRYRAADDRMFHRDSEYLEGRQIREALIGSEEDE
jgi:hypothetical protein